MICMSPAQQKFLCWEQEEFWKKSTAVPPWQGVRTDGPC